MFAYEEKEVLDPLCLKWAYGLKDEELADILALQPRTIRHYAAKQRTPSNQIKMLAAFVHREFQRRNIPLVDPSAIKMEVV